MLESSWERMKKPLLVFNQMVESSSEVKQIAVDQSDNDPKEDATIAKVQFRRINWYTLVNRGTRHRASSERWSCNWGGGFNHRRAVLEREPLMRVYTFGSRYCSKLDWWFDSFHSAYWRWSVDLSMRMPLIMIDATCNDPSLYNLVHVSSFDWWC